MSKPRPQLCEGEMELEGKKKNSQDGLSVQSGYIECIASDLIYIILSFMLNIYLYCSKTCYKMSGDNFMMGLRKTLVIYLCAGGAFTFRPTSIFFFRFSQGL